MIGRGARRLVAAVAATALVGLVGPTSAGAATAASQAPAVVGIRALDQTAWVTRGGRWQLELALTGAPAGSTVTAAIYPRVDDRSEYEASILGVLDGPVKARITEVAVDDAELRSDGSRSVTLAVSLRQSNASQPGWEFLPQGLLPGVYPVDIRVVDADGVERSRVVAHLTRVPSGDEDGADDAPILVAPIVRLSDEPTVDADGHRRSGTGIDGQVDELAAGLTAGEGLPLTLIPRPESVEALARDEDTADSLQSLQSLARTRQVVDGPYVEVPLTAWTDRGMTDELSRQRVRGNSVLTEHLGRVDSSTWDARTGLTPTATEELWPVGVRSVILAPGALGSEPVTGPVLIPAGGAGSMEAVVPDQVLSGALARRDDPVLAAGDFAAELALRAATTSGPQGVVLDPPEGWLDDPTNVAQAEGVLLDPDAPVQAVTLAEMLEAVPPVGQRQLADTIPLQLYGYPERLGLARARLGSYASLVGAEEPEVGSLDQRILLSGSVELSEAERSAYVEKVLVVTERRFQAIRVPGKQTVTLTSSDGELPLTLLNELDVPATVSIELSADSRIEVRDFDRTPTLQPGTNHLEIPVHARAPGDSGIDITVRTTDGEVRIAEVDYTVRSTAVPGIGIVLSVGAVAFLMIWWARHWLRDRRARGEGGGGDDGPDEPEPAPDAPPGANEPAPGELVST